MSKPQIVSMGTYAELIKIVQSKWGDRAKHQHVLVENPPDDLIFTGQTLQLEGRRHYLISRWYNPDFAIMIPGLKGT